MKKISLCVIGTLLFFASNASANCSGQLVVKGQGDLDGISGCKTYSGSIKVDATNAAELRLNGVEVVSGDLQIGNNDGLVKLFLPNLQTVNGRMILNNNKLLASIDMPKVTAVNTFEITVHPALKMLKFPSKLKAVQRFNMGDTFATEIQGLAFSTAREVEVKNNIYLKQLQLGNVTVVESIQIYANSPALTIDLSKLEEVRAAEFRNAAGVSLEKLRQVNGDISFIANTFPSLDMPNLQEIVGTLNIADNTQLSKLSMQKLNRLGGALSVGGNKQLVHVDAFPSLQAIEGSVDCYGEFDDFEFPVLNDVRGGLNIQSSSQMFNCDGMNQMKNGVIKGTTFTCVGSVAQPKPAGLTEGGSFGGANGARGSNKLKKVSSAPISLPQSWFTSLSLLLFVAYYISI